MRPSRLQYESRISSGVDFAAADLEREDGPSRLRYIRTTDIAAPTRLTDGGVYVDARLVPDTARVLRGDLLFTRAGSVGTSYLHDGPEAAFAGYLVRCRLAPGNDPRFFAYWAQSRPFWDEVSVGAVRSTIDNFSARKYGSMPVPLPPLEVQRRIADYLDAETARIDSVLKRNRELSRLARERHERTVVELASRGTSPRATGEDLGWCAGVEADFVVGTYAMYGRTGSGHTPSRSVPEYWVGCDIPWVTTADVHQLRSGYVERLGDTAEKISRLGMAHSAARLHPAGTVFLSRTASVGFAGIMHRPMATSQDFFTWTPDRRLTSEYLLWALRAMRYGGLFDRLMYGSTHKTIYMPDLLGLRGPIPPLAEQQRIVDGIRENRDHTVALTDRIERANALLRERRAALITAAVTGELVV